ncbi:hypothetical protein PMAYCL1PPCAC_16457, partial [Pristionchus mayeri]
LFLPLFCWNRSSRYRLATRTVSSGLGTTTELSDSHQIIDGRPIHQRLTRASSRGDSSPEEYERRISGIIRYDRSGAERP